MKISQIIKMPEKYQIFRFKDICEEITTYLDQYDIFNLVIASPPIFQEFVEHVKEVNFCHKILADQDLSLFSYIKKLNLNFNKKITDNSVSLLTNIENLELVENNLITDNSLHVLTNITKLNLCNNRGITDNSLSILTNIKKLDLCNNEIITNNSLSLLTIKI